MIAKELSLNIVFVHYEIIPIDLVDRFNARNNIAEHTGLVAS